jgi:hypothetical protein
MPETVPNPTPESTPPESLGWRAGLPDDLKQNESFKSFKTVGDFAKSHLDTAKKLSDAETKLKDSIPRLPDNATDEEKQVYFGALGRPEKASEYELEGEDKNAPAWTSLWKNAFHKNGLTKSQAKGLSEDWNQYHKNLFDGFKANRDKEIAEAETKLRTEWGDKFPANVELAKRMWTKHGEGDFDTAFAKVTPEIKNPIMRMIVKFANLTGEDRSPQGSQFRGSGVKPTGINYDKSHMPPDKV